MPPEIKEIHVPLNRVEGDLEVTADIRDNVIENAWSAGTLYRGFEVMMKGRGPLDGLVITPRICGICSLTHLNAAVEALDRIAGVTPPDNALRLRNLALMAEIIQSDLRQSILMFMVDFTNPGAYASHSLFEEATQRYQPLRGERAMAVIRSTKKLIEVIAVIGGQWPHTSFVVPGGVTAFPDVHKLMQCRVIINGFRQWFEQHILGCSLDRWLAITSRSQLEEWLEEDPAHRNGDLGFFLRFCHEAGLDDYGQAHEDHISFGSFPMPLDTRVRSAGNRDISPDVTGLENRMSPSGTIFKGRHMGLDPSSIREDVACAWFEDEEQPRHPFDGDTRPYASGNMGDRYSWVKAPRYRESACETGPVSEMLLEQNPLFLDLVRAKGTTVMIRQLARMVRTAGRLDAMAVWIDELMARSNKPFYTPATTIPDGQAAGMIQAARGALGHWVKIKNGKIRQYQIITPTAWNGSPRDGTGVPGPWEAALAGTPVKDPDNPVEAGHVVRSFDPCMVCAVHTLKRNPGKNVIQVNPVG